MSSTYRKSRTYVNARDASKMCVCVFVCRSKSRLEAHPTHNIYPWYIYIYPPHKTCLHFLRYTPSASRAHSSFARANCYGQCLLNDKITIVWRYATECLNAHLKMCNCGPQKSKHLNGFCHKVKRVADVDLHMDTHFTWMASQSAPRQHRAYICSYSYMFAKQNSKTSARAAKHIQNETPSTDYMVFAAVCRWLCVMWKGCAWWYGIQVHERARNVRTQWAMCAISQHHHYFNKDIFIERARECAFVQVYSRWALFALCVMNEYLVSLSYEWALWWCQMRSGCNWTAHIVWIYRRRITDAD